MPGPTRNGGMFGRPQGSISAYKPTLGDLIQGRLTSGLSYLGVDPRYASHVADRATSVLRDLTPVGDAMTAQQAGRDFQSGHYARGGLNSLLAGVGLIPGVGDAAAKIAGRGTFKEWMREGNQRFLDYVSPSGHTASVHLIVDKDGIAEIAIDPMLSSGAFQTKYANRFGPAEVRAAATELRRLYPEIKGVRGMRESGAGPGRVQSIDLQRR